MRGARRADARAVLVGTAFSAMAALLFLHGLATPDVLLPEQAGDQTPLLAFAGGATLPVGGAILALAAWPAILRSESVPTILRLQAAGVELVSQEEAYLGTHIRALMIALAAKDGSTEGHTRRVAQLAVQVGEVLGLAPHRLRALAIGGLLHDIGKMQIPDAILKKPGPLDDSEYEVVKHHPDWGDRLAGELGLPRRVRLLIRHHHERLDGTGYPTAGSPSRSTWMCASWRCATSTTRSFQSGCIATPGRPLRRCARSRPRRARPSTGVALPHWRR